ncbi:MAG: hypothetical protein HY902_10915 [Deltaproteobacteria bacterium]|nr:hypothetical protein [Deltaproteobacteria bacterium]
MAQHTVESVDAAAHRVTLALEVGLYPIEVLYGAAYVFIDRCFVLLDKDEGKDGPSKGGRYLVHLRGKTELSKKELLDLSGEFGNELLSQALRRKVVKANQKIIEEITTQAIAGAAGGTLPTDFLDSSDDGMDFLDDPLGIAVPWEDKFKKKSADQP